MAQETQWAVSLFGIGDVGSCLYSWICTPCALAQARTNLDDSSCCFNCCFLTSCPERWMIRTAYGIKGNAWEDCYIPCFCPCCTANQVVPLFDSSTTTSCIPFWLVYHPLVDLFFLPISCCKLPNSWVIPLVQPRDNTCNEEINLSVFLPSE